MPRNPLLLACLLLIPTMAAAQTRPANVVTPAPPPREGTVGPEQLRDFSLPGTRREEAPADSGPAAPPTASPARPGPSTPAGDRPTPAPRTTTAMTPRRSESVALPPAAPTPSQRAEAGPSETRPSEEITLGLEPALPTPAPAIETAPTTLPGAPEPLAQDSATEATGFAWWPWLLAAALAGIALALVLRRRGSREAFAAPASDLAPPPAPPPSARTPPPSAPPAQPPLPSGLVTTRLRSPANAASEPVGAAAPAPVGAVVSTRFRPWIDLDLTIGEILLDEEAALIRFKVALLNSGSASARDIVVEALPLNAGESQAADLASFYRRSSQQQGGIAELPRGAATELTHEVRMQRTGIRAYEAQGRRLFVPILAFNASYRWHSGEGRSSAAFLLGHEQPGSERLAPLVLHDGPLRLGRIGVRRLEEALRT